MVKYRPVDPRESPRFAGIKTFMRLPHVTATEGVDVAVVGVPFDTGASYRVGARFGPEAIRSVSALLRHHNEVLDVSIFDHCSVVDYGDLPINPGYIEDSYTMIEEGLLPILDGGVTPIMLGGDHSVTLPELRAMAKTHGPVALIHLDSHSDTGDKRFGRSEGHDTEGHQGNSEPSFHRCLQHITVGKLTFTDPFAAGGARVDRALLPERQIEPAPSSY